MKGGGSGFVVLNKRQVMNRKSSSKKSGEVSKGCSRILKDPKTSAVLFFKHPVNMDFVL